MLNLQNMGDGNHSIVQAIINFLLLLSLTILPLVLSLFYVIAV